MPRSSNRNNRRFRLQKNSNVPVKLQVLKPSVPNTPTAANNNSGVSANNNSRVSANSKSGGTQKRAGRRPNAPMWLTLFLTIFYGIVLLGAVAFAIITKVIMIMVLVVLVVFATFLFVIKHFYPSEGSSPSPILTFILEVLKIFKGIH